MTPESDIGKRIAKSGIIAVLMIEREEDAVPTVRALLNGGVDAIELTLRTDAALAALYRIRHEVPQILAGVGTIINPRQVGQVKDTGAHFGVAPGVNAEVVMHAKHNGLPFTTGVMTPTDIDQSITLGCRLLKFFPAESAGGLKHLHNIAAPYQHLGMGFIPLGGVNPDNLQEYLSSPLVTAVGGSWLAPKDLIAEQNWDEISRRAEHARKVADKIS
tara:strand:- start:24087 stop:24737 length:651 start_codon:yes stop_codon:yes gene_type:complete